MKKLLTIALLFYSVLSFSQSVNNGIALIPEPVSMKTGAGKFSLPQTIQVQAPSDPSLKQALLFLTDRLSVPTGRKVKVSSASPTASIRLQLNKPMIDKIGSEGYTLSATSKNI